MLAFGATQDSSNVNETRQEELEKLVEDLESPISTEIVEEIENNNREEANLVAKAPFLAVAVLESML